MRLNVDYRFRLVFRGSIKFFSCGAVGEASLWKSIFCTKMISSPLTSFSPSSSARLGLTLTHSHHPDNPVDRVNTTCSSYVHIVRRHQHTHTHAHKFSNPGEWVYTFHTAHVHLQDTHSHTHKFT